MHSSLNGAMSSDSHDIKMEMIDTVSATVEKRQNGKKYDLENGTADVAPQPEHPPSRVRHPTTYFETFLHIFKANIGSGLLAMGDAFKNGGLVFATLMTAFLGVTCVHAQHQLLNCSTKVQEKKKMKDPPNFAQTVELCFETGPISIRWLSKYMGYLINIFLCVTQLGFCCVYVVFIATNAKAIFDQYHTHMKLWLHMIWVMFPISAVCLIRNLKCLAPISTVANFLFIIGVGMVLYEAVQDLPPVSDRNYLADWQQLPLYLGTAVYAFEGIGLVLPLKNEMKRPDLFQKRLGVLNVGMVVVGSTFITVGFLGYLKWGEEVQGSLTLNLGHGVLSNIVQGLITLGILLTYPLQLYVPVNIIWSAIHKRFELTKKRPVLAERMLRMLLILLTFVLAEAIPQLGLFISLVGAVSSTALALIFPPLIDIITDLQTEENRPWCLFKNSFIILLGLFIFSTGTYQSISEIVKAFQTVKGNSMS